MNTIWQIARITFKEGLRHRIIYGTFIGAILLIGFSTIIAGIYMRDLLKIILDICLSAVSLGGLLVPFFFVINLFLGDLENKTAYAILSRPMSRTQYILGKYLGFALLTTLIVSILTLSTFLAVWGARFFYYVNLFSYFSLTSVLISSSMTLLGILVLNSVVLLWCSLTKSTFLATLLAFATYIIGHTIEDMVYFVSLQLSEAQVSPIFEKFINTLLYICPNLSAFDLKQLAAYGHVIAPQEIMFLTLYGFSYIAIMLMLTTYRFKQLDLT